MSYLKRHMSKNCNLSFTTNRVYVFFTDFFLKKYIFLKNTFFKKYNRKYNRKRCYAILQLCKINMATGLNVSATNWT